ncbi:hypothetical protein NXS19_002208 [Fusarium pseudograminearum]|nr:hypothetical protein NXS19_002208 [Fusarium pseudograminearum]
MRRTSDTTTVFQLCPVESICATTFCYRKFVKMGGVVFGKAGVYAGIVQSVICSRLAIVDVTFLVLHEGKSLT